MLIYIEVTFKKMYAHVLKLNKQFNNLVTIDTFIKKKLTMPFLHVYGINIQNTIGIRKSADRPLNIVQFTN